MTYKTENLMDDFSSIQLPWPDWKIVRYLGGGGYGKVYEIEKDTFGIVENAALKIISRPKDNNELESYRDNGYDEDSVRISFEGEIKNYLQEYKLMKELQGQSNIVNVETYAVVPHKNGIGGDIFLMMELLTPLPQMLRERMLSEKEMISLGKDISHALTLCEKKNIIHRDIKPANIMVSAYGNFKLGDFGVSKMMDHTTFATMKGMQDYEAPEVVQREKYGHQADIYSLGITLYWLLNNRKMPFIGADEVLTAELRERANIRRYRGDALPPPKDGSTALKQVVLKACAYKSADRYSSAQELYDALVMVEAGKTQEAFGKSEKSDFTARDEEKSADTGSFKTQWNTIGSDSRGSYHGSGDYGTNGQTSGNSWGGDSSGGTIGRPGSYGGRRVIDCDPDHDGILDETVGTQNGKTIYETDKSKQKGKSEQKSSERKKAAASSSIGRGLFVSVLYFIVGCIIIYFFEDPTTVGADRWPLLLLICIAFFASGPFISGVFVRWSVGSSIGCVATVLQSVEIWCMFFVLVWNKTQNIVPEFLQALSYFLIYFPGLIFAGIGGYILSKWILGLKGEA